MIEQRNPAQARDGSAPIAALVARDRSAPAGDPTRLFVGIAIAASIVSAVGSLLPWFEANMLFADTQVSGVQSGDGVITLVAGLIGGGAGALAFFEGSRFWRVVLLIAGVVVAGTALYNIGHYYEVVSENPIAGGLVQLAPGIFITAVGGGGTAVGGVLSLLSQNPANEE